MKVKTILGAIGAIGMALGGLVLASKNEFGKGLEKPSEPDLEDESDGITTEEETTTSDSEEEETEE